MRTGDLTLDAFLVALREDRDSMRHLRIGQWLINAVGNRDLYYIENDELIAALEKYREIYRPAVRENAGQ